MKFGFELETIVGIKKDEFNVFRDLNVETLTKTIKRIVQKRKEDKAKILKIITPYIESRLRDDISDLHDAKESNKEDKEDNKEKREHVKDMVDRVLSSEIDKLPRSAIEKEVHNCFEMFENDFVYSIDYPSSMTPRRKRMIFDGKHLQLIKSSFILALKTIFEEFKKSYEEYKKNRRKVSKYIGLFNQHNIETLFKDGTIYEFGLFRDYIETSNEDLADALRSFIRFKEVQLITDLLNEDDPQLSILTPN